MKPSDFARKYPWDSVEQKSESETTARDIMIILKRTGDTWRTISFEEYEAAVRADNNEPVDRVWFNRIVGYTVSESGARKFSSAWKSL